MIEPKIYMNGHWMVPYKGGIFYRIHVYGSEMQDGHHKTIIGLFHFFNLFLLNHWTI
jgi:hypothetical protein